MQLHTKYQINPVGCFQKEVENIIFYQKWQKYLLKIEKLLDWHEMNKSDRALCNVTTYQISEQSVVFKKKLKILVLTKNDQKYSPKIQNLRYWHEMNKSEREPPKVLVYQISKHPDYWFSRRRLKCNCWRTDNRRTDNQ